MTKQAHDKIAEGLRGDLAAVDPTHETTLKSRKPPAQICRERGWGPGVRIVGDEGYGPTVIEITAVGEESILAKTISHNGKPIDWSYEGLWCLNCRDWMVQS